MKKIWLIMISIIMAAGLVFLGCGDDPNDPNNPNNPTGDTVEITFHANGGMFTSNLLGFRRIEIPKGGKVTPPADAVLEEHALKEWNTLENGTGTALTADTTHDVDTMYYAIWEQTAFNVTAEWDYSNINPVLMPDDTNVNTWFLKDDALDTVKSAEPGSVLRLHFDATGGAGSNRNNWGIGSIGTATSALDADVLGLRTGQDTPLGPYYVDAEIDWLLDILERNDFDQLMIFVPVNNRDKLMKIELLEPDEGRIAPVFPVPPALPPAHGPGSIEDGDFIARINITYGYFGDKTIGKGEIAGADLQLIRTTVNGLDLANERILLRLVVRNTLDADRSGWADCGTIGGNTSAGGIQFGGAPALSFRANDFGIDRVNQLLNLNRTLELNPYNGQVISLIELWVVPYQSMNVKVGGTVMEDIIVGARSGVVKHYTDKSGYEVLKGANHRSDYAYFRIDFGPGKTLADYAQIKFTVVDVVTSGTSESNDLTRRFALIGSVPAIGTASLGTHATGGSDVAAQLVGSNHGWLAAGQVTVPMDESIHNNTLPQTITLNIAPSVAYLNSILPPEFVAGSFTDVQATNALAARQVYLSLYEHANAALVKITNIEFIERDDSLCTFCNVGEDECVCDAAITAAKGIITAAAPFTAPQAGAGTADAARVRVQNIMSALGLNGVTPTAVDAGTFTAAVQGTEANPNGSNGVYTFTVKLNRGFGTEQTIDTALTLNIEATKFVPPLQTVGTVLYDMQNDANLTSLNGGSRSHTNGYLVTSLEAGVSTVVDMDAIPKTVTVATRGGSSQGIRINVTSFNTTFNVASKEGYTFRVYYHGIIGATDFGRLRVESGGGVAQAVIAGSLATTGTDPDTRAFTLVHDITQAQLLSWAGTTISVGTGGNNPLTYTQLIITEIAPIEGECSVCGIPPLPCDCDDAIGAAKTAIDAHDFLPIEAPTETAARTAVTTVINGLRGTVAATLEDVVYTAATEAATGSIVFKVGLTRGNGAKQTSIEKTAVINVLEGAWVDVTVFSLAKWLEDNPTVTDIVQDASTAPFRLNSSNAANNTAAIEGEGANRFLRATAFGSGQGLNIVGGSHATGLNLDILANKYTITVVGTITATSSTTAQLRIRYRGVSDVSMFDATGANAIAPGEAFNITVEFPALTAGFGSGSGEGIGFTFGGSGNQTLHITDIQIINKGPR